MKLYALSCPKCGAELSAPDDHDFIFCTYCGTKIMIDREDGAEVIHAKAHMKEVELKSELKRRGMEILESRFKVPQKTEKEREATNATIITIVILIVSVPLMYLVFTKVLPILGIFAVLGNLG